MILKVSIILLCCFLLVEGQDYAKRPPRRPRKCRQVECRPSRCVRSVVTRLQRTCCPSCRPKPAGPDCSLVDCADVSCSGKFKLKGDCCFRCPSPPPKCLGIQCGVPRCGAGVLPTLKRGDCCPSCPSIPGCYAKNGKHYRPEDKVPNSDPCKWCTCSKNGKIVCAIASCARPNCLNPIKEPGKCCQTCPPDPYVCRKNGKYYKVGETMSDPDPCMYCTCTQQGEVCAIRDCPRPNCESQQRLPGQCCPVCPDVCVEGGKTYFPGQNVPRADVCTTCQCLSGGEIECIAQSCKQLHCLNPTRHPGECCSTCPLGCYSGGLRYELGAEMTNENQPCKTCICGKGGVRSCTSVKCRPVRCQYPVPGACCPTCPPTGGY